MVFPSADPHWSPAQIKCVCIHRDLRGSCSHSESSRGATATVTKSRRLSVFSFVKLNTVCVKYSPSAVSVFPTAKASFQSFISQLFIIDHNQVDWRIAMTSQRVLVITLELLVCVIHPVGTYLDAGTPANSSSSNATAAPPCISNSRGDAHMDLELLLSMLMFLRLYLVHRTILLHSKVLLSASYRSIGSLNNINFTFRFVLKVLLNKYPGRTLLIFILFFWLTASWMLTLCERWAKQQVGTNAMIKTWMYVCKHAPSIFDCGQRKKNTFFFQLFVRE